MKQEKMKIGCYKIVIFFAIQCCFIKAYSQNTESLKVALTYKIANCVIWRTDTSSLFTIGVFSNNQELINKFNELAKIAKINKKSIQVVDFSRINAIKQIHLLYVDKEYNSLFTTINQKINQWNTLLVSDENNRPGEIMINLKIENQKGNLTFEYNRANILFAGLEITEQIVILKGTEIEIRELYLRAKKLWDEQKNKADSLERKTKLQEMNLKAQRDSMSVAKTRMEENVITIQNQNHIIAGKDSVSTNLNHKITEQRLEIDKNRTELVRFKSESTNFLNQIYAFQKDVGTQKKLSDSLAFDILQKKNELAIRKKAIGEKESIIQKQSNWLLILALIITVVCILVFVISRAYIANKKARVKIAEQKEELQDILEKLQNTQQQLIQSEKMASLGVLVAGIAHEINNPVNFINSGIAGIEKVVNKILLLLNELNKLKEDSTTEEIKELVERLQMQHSIDMMPEIIENIKLGINRTIAIIDGLRLYTRVDLEEKSLNDINHIIDTSLLLLKPRIKDSIEIETNYNNLPLIPVFPAKLSQVFINILTNAIDSVLENSNQGEKALIQIHTKELNGKIIIEFTDSGNGIPSEILNKLFDPFFTTKIVGKGTGLGLSISYGIIAEHKGKIVARNNSSKGATFTVELPVNDYIK
jgi:C4-dicarboxylate-specific signal transduction histidine kinase